MSGCLPGAGRPVLFDYCHLNLKISIVRVRRATEEAAETIVKGIKAKNPRILIGRDARAINYISRLFPKKYLRVIEKLAGHKLDLRKES